MLTEEKCYSATCDVCGNIFRSFIGWDMFNDKQNLTEELDEANWYYGTDKNEHQDKTYCDQCHHYDDEDVLHVKEKQLTAGTGESVR